MSITDINEHLTRNWAPKWTKMANFHCLSLTAARGWCHMKATKELLLMVITWLYTILGITHFKCRDLKWSVAPNVHMILSDGALRKNADPMSNMLAIYFYAIELLGFKQCDYVQGIINRMMISTMSKMNIVTFLHRDGSCYTFVVSH